MTKTPEELQAELDKRVIEVEKHVPGMRRVLEDVVDERIRQAVREGFSSIHDDERNQNYELARYGACMATLATLNDASRKFIDGQKGRDVLRSPGYPLYAFEAIYRLWPLGWDINWLKPKSRRHDLIRAIASLIAEVERLDRLEAKKPADQIFPSSS